MSTEIKGIFFDIGGTLVMKAKNAERDQAVIARMVTLLGLSCTPAELIAQIKEGEDKYKTWRSISMKELPPEERWPRFLLSGLPHETVRNNAVMLQSLWSESRGKRSVPAETVDTLQELNKRGYLLGTISHTSPAYLEASGVLPLFKTIIHAAQFGWRKPHPTPFLEAARRSGLLPQECAYVGDRPSRDVIGAREAGFGMVIQLILSDEPTESIPCPMKPDVTLHSLAGLLDLFAPLDRASMSVPGAGKEPILYDAALSTMWWNKEEWSADEFCAKGRQLGFARFELNHQIPPGVLAQFNLDRYHMGALHDPCPAYVPAKTLERADQVITSLDETLRRQAVEGVKKTIEAAYQLGARHVVIHPGRVVGDHSLDDRLRVLFREGKKGTPEFEELRQSVIADRAQRSKPHLAALVKSLREIIAFAEGKLLTLGLENRYHYYELPIFDEMEVLLSEFQQPWVGWHLDVGHLQTHFQLGLTDFDAWLEQLGQRITGVHLHDVRGITDHQAPGKGEVDFARIAAALPLYCFRTLEVDKSATMEEMSAGLKTLAQAGCISFLSRGEENV